MLPIRSLFSRSSLVHSCAQNTKICISIKRYVPYVPFCVLSLSLYRFAITSVDPRGEGGNRFELCLFLPCPNVAADPVPQELHPDANHRRLTHRRRDEEKIKVSWKVQSQVLKSIYINVWPSLRNQITCTQIQHLVVHFIFVYVVVAQTDGRTDGRTDGLSPPLFLLFSMLE